jgi:uncharacterized damage-inducible protein DinB
MGKSYGSDFAHIPADKQVTTPMGVARPASEFTAECASFNRFVAKMVRGQEVPQLTDEQRKAYYASFDTGDKAIAEFNASVEDLSAALTAASDEDLSKEITMPWGDQSPLWAAVHMAASHMMYHQGQINYIQALYGDGESHWG